VAYKRTVSRLGRWPWQTFDEGYWDDFAHGKAPKEIGTSGVAGFQYQQHIDATGWLGQKTFDALCYAVVPRDLPNGGEQAMDKTAVDLINEAWDMFQGHEKPPVPANTLRQEALKRAIAQIGTAESPRGSNKQKYGEWYGYNGVPWCAIFCTWCYETGARNSPAFVRGSRWAYVPYIVADARARRNGVQTTDDPIPGDLICYDWERNGEYDHVGLFEKWVGSGGFSAIEGNTSTASNSNGGQVMRRTRYKSGQGTVFVRVVEP
jgi:hypothetical protein